MQLKKKQLEQANEQMKNILQPKLLNLPNYLVKNNLKVFSDWLLLNDAALPAPISTPTPLPLADPSLSEEKGTMGLAPAPAPVGVQLDAESASSFETCDRCGDESPLDAAAGVVPWLCSSW